MATKIEYNGSVVATIPSGNKATIPIANKKMKTDIVITVPEAEGGGTDSPLPIAISTEAEMTALLTSGEIGGVYKYTGTTGTYENGALYVLEEEEVEDELQGTWVFNDTLAWEDFGSHNVNFTSNSKTFTSIAYGTDPDYMDSAALVYANDSETVYAYNFEYTNEWSNEAYKTIVITSEPTDETFITWLKANATKQ